MQPTATRTVVVQNPLGLHLRAASALAQAARPFESKVELIKNSHRVEATDVLQILSLGAESGTQLVLEARGPDAESALEALARLFTEKFGEE